MNCVRQSSGLSPYFALEFSVVVRSSTYSSTIVRTLLQDCISGLCGKIWYCALVRTRSTSTTVVVEIFEISERSDRGQSGVLAVSGDHSACGVVGCAAVGNWQRQSRGSERTLVVHSFVLISAIL